MSTPATANTDIASAIAEAQARFTAANPDSQAQLEKAAKVLPGGNTRTVLFYPPFPLTITKGEGCHLWDLDGHQYIDFLGEYTAGLFGHSNPIIRAAIDRALNNGIVMGGQNRAEADLGAAIVGRFPGIDTPASTSAINTKSKFREVAATVGLPIPRILLREQAAGADTVIVKPVDSFSGRGMTVLHEPTMGRLSEALAVARQASRTGDAIVEEFIEGQLFSHSAFIWNEEVVADFVVQEDCTTNPFTVDTSRVVFDFDSEMLECLREGVCRLAASLCLSNGLMHTQFIVHGSHFWVIEMTRRCPGDLYSLLIEFSTGYSYAASYAAPFVEGGPIPENTGGSEDRIIRHTVTSRNGASLWGFHFRRSVDIQLFVPLATSGDFIGPSPNGRGGIFFLRSPSKCDQEELYQELLSGNLYSFS